jgi:hypothetical protein
MFSPNGRLLATGGDGVRIWELDSGQQVRFMSDHHDQMVHTIVFSGDGRTLASANRQSMVRIWEIATAKELRKFGNHEGLLYGLSYSPNGENLASSDLKGNVVLWDVRTSTVPKNGEGLTPMRPTPAFLADAWAALGGINAAKAYDAVLALSNSETSIVIPFLRDHLRPAVAVAVSKNKLDQLIRDLADDQFRVRDKAMADLAELGIAALPALRAALAKHESLEADRRITLLLAKFDAAGRTSEHLQSIRALRILEEFDTPDARRIVMDLAAGAPGDRLTMEAQTALSRMNRRQSK